MVAACEVGRPGPGASHREDVGVCAWGSPGGRARVSARTRPVCLLPPGDTRGVRGQALCERPERLWPLKRGVPAGRGRQGGLRGEIRRGRRPDRSEEPQLSSCEVVSKPVSFIPDEVQVHLVIPPRRPCPCDRFCGPGDGRCWPEARPVGEGVSSKRTLVQLCRAGGGAGGWGGVLL